MKTGRSHRILGKIVVVDLTASRIDIVEDPRFEAALGGRGYGSRVLFDELSENTDPLDAGNILAFAAGGLTGSSFPGASRTALVTGNVLSGGISTSSGGANWGPELRRAGFDAVIVKGKASSPVWLWIRDGGAELRNASALWGKTVGQAVDGIRAELSDSGVQVAGIGPAGERLVRVSCVMLDRAQRRLRGS